jgi:hypothetical protein
MKRTYYQEEDGTVWRRVVTYLDDNGGRTLMRSENGDSAIVQLPIPPGLTQITSNPWEQYNPGGGIKGLNPDDDSL